MRAPRSSVSLYRTHASWLTADQLILLDILSHYHGNIPSLSREGFLERYFLGYTHSLDDSALACNVRWLCEHGILDQHGTENGPIYEMTRAGGELWSRERLPVWERYCSIHNNRSADGRIRDRVLAVSPDVRDHWLDLYPQYPGQRKKAISTNHPLIEWHPFPKVYVGFATYQEPRSQTGEEYPLLVDEVQRHWDKVRREQSWWTTIPELQRFVTPQFL